MKKGLFFFFIILALISFILTIKKFNTYFYINYYGGAYSTLTFNLEMPKDTKDVFLLFNENERAEFNSNKFPLQTLAPQNDIYSIAVIENPEIMSLELFVPESEQNNLKKLIIFNNAKEYYFNDITSFEHETKEYCNEEDICKDYEVYKIPKEISEDKNSEAYNYRGIWHNILIILLSVFYNPQYFIFFWLFLACAYAVNCFSKIKGEITFPEIIKKLAFPAIIIFGIVLRLIDIDLYPLWNDEMAGMIFTRTGALSDKGTLPSIIILIQMWKGMFGTSLLALRLMPVIFSVLSIWGIYEFIKFASKSKMFAYTGTFLLTINIFAVYLSQELRSYSLSMLITAFLGLYLFKVIENSSKKNLIIYILWAILAFNTHYYLILLVVFNFFYYLFRKWRNIKEIKSFVLGHIFVGLCFIPAFWSIVTSAWQNTQFNSWIPKLTIHQMQETAMYFFGDTRVFWFLVIFFSVYYLISFIKPKIFEYIPKEDKTLFNYCSAALIFILFATLIISLKRPIFFTKYFMCVLPLFVVVYSMFLNIFFRTKLWGLHIAAAIIMLIMTSRFTPEVARAEYLQEGINHIAAYESLEDAQEGKKIALLVPDRKTTKAEADFIRDEFDYFIYIYPESVLPHIYQRLDDEGYNVVFTDAMEDYEFEKFMEHAQKYDDVKLIYNEFMYKRIVKAEKK